MSYAVECPYMPVMWKIYEKYLRSIGKCMLNQYEHESLAQFFQIVANRNNFTICGDVEVRAPTNSERERYFLLYGLDSTTQLAIENYLDYDEADALETYFALLGGNLNFCRDQFLMQVRN
jgi:hypothetical protein